LLFVVVTPTGLKVKLMSFISFAPSVTLAVCVPSFSCHASIVYVPGGRFGRSSLPSSSLTA